MKYPAILVLALSAAATCATDAAVQPVGLPAVMLSALRFVAWPAGAMDADAFVLCYRGGESLDQALPVLEGKLVQGRTLQLRRLDTPARALGCHALYLPAGSEERERYIEAVALRPVLTIGNDVEILSLGADLALLPAARRLRPAVNADAVQRSGLRVDARLLRVARRPLPPGPPR